MDTADFDVAALINAGAPLTNEQFQQMVAHARSSERNHVQFTDIIDGMDGSGDGAAALILAQGYFSLTRYSEALAQLEKAGDGPTQTLLRARCLHGAKAYDEAIAAYEAAESQGFDSFETAMAVTECLREKGDLEAADQRLCRVSRVGEIRAAYHYQLGRLHQANGDYEQAAAEYQQTIQLDADHHDALFHLAYICNLHGDEDEAIRHYEQCVAGGKVHVRALLNLAVLCEDAEDYDYAERIVQQVLDAYPNNERARMFFKDIRGSKVMYYDEEQERRIDRRNQVLEIPISDFELSVRSRNCLKKMNIRYLGDLLRVTESELLAYKNFGETSLLEIKAILNQKNLRLGQLLEERAPTGEGMGGREPVDGDNELLSKTVDDLELSVRSRKCLQRLNIVLLRDLCNCTEAELLGCKNFGQTSLLEIKQRLKEKGLNLRQLD